MTSDENYRLVTCAVDLADENARLREDIVRLERERIVEFCDLQNENARLREMIENLRNVCTTENESTHDLANRILHILSNVRGQMPRSDGATDAGEERASASGVTARRGYLDCSVGILSSREKCIAIGILADLNDLVRRLGSGEVLDRAFYEDLIQWFTVEFPSAGTDKFAIVKPAQRMDDFCSAVLASCGERDAVERAVRAKSSDGIGFGGIQEELREWRIECHSDLISSPNDQGQLRREDKA